MKKFAVLNILKIKFIFGRFCLFSHGHFEESPGGVPLKVEV